MSAEGFGRASVILAIAVSLSVQVVGSAIELGWGSDPDRDMVLHEHFGLAIPQYASPSEVAFSLLISVALCWALYAGYRWARWLWVLLYVVVLGFVGSSVISTGLPPLTADRWSVLMALPPAASVVCLVALLLPSTGSFLRSQRTRSSRGRPAA